MKQRTIVTVMALAALALSSATAVAQEDTSGTSNTPVKTLLQIKDRAVEKRDAVLERQAQLKVEFEARKASTTTRILERKNEIKDRIASTTERKVERKAEIELRKASSTERRIDRQQDIAKRQAEHAGKRLVATIERLEKIIARVESRIEKLKAEGVDVAASAGFVAEAKVHLSEARQSIEAFSSVDLSADKAKENFERVRTLASEVKTHLKAAHQSLMEAVRALKGSNSAEVKVEATSTVEVE